MKITKRQLRRVVRESIGDARAKRNNVLVTKSQLRLIIREAVILEGQGATKGFALKAMGPEGRQKAAGMVSRVPDAFQIYKALLGLGTDEDAVWDVLERRRDSIPQLYQEFDQLMEHLKRESAGFSGKVKKYGVAFLKTSGLFALAAGLIFGLPIAAGGAAIGGMAGGIGGALGVGAVGGAAGIVGSAISSLGTAMKAGAVVTAAKAIVDMISPATDDDLIEWLEDDGMDDAAEFVRVRVQPLGK